MEDLVRSGIRQAASMKVRPREYLKSSLSGLGIDILVPVPREGITNLGGGEFRQPMKIGVM